MSRFVIDGGMEVQRWSVRACERVCECVSVLELVDVGGGRVVGGCDVRCAMLLFALSSALLSITHVASLYISPTRSEKPIGC